MHTNSSAICVCQLHRNVKNVADWCCPLMKILNQVHRYLLAGANFWRISAEREPEVQVHYASAKAQVCSRKINLQSIFSICVNWARVFDMSAEKGIISHSCIQKFKFRVWTESLYFRYWCQFFCSSWRVVQT